MSIGKYFTLAELTVTKSGLPNIPNQAETEALTELVKNVLDPLRELYGRPIHVNSGFRSAEVNRLANGVPTSQHCKGEAADLDCENNLLLFQLIRDNLVFDQVISESGKPEAPAWVHVSYKKLGNRGERLRMENGKYTKL